MKYLDKDYMYKHIKRYIEFQLGQGYEIEDIRQAMLRYGYDRALLDEICAGIDPDVHRPLKHKPSIKALNEDLYIYLQNLLIDYIKKEQAQGYELEVIEKALINYGHHEPMVRAAVKAINEGMVIDQDPVFRLPALLSLIIGLAAIMAFVVVLSVKTEASIGLVFVSFAPSIVAVLFTYTAFMSIDHRQINQMLPLLSIVIVVLLFLGISQVSADVRNLSEPQTVLILNAFLAFIPGVLISLMSKKGPRKITAKAITESAGASVQ